ncbi:DUF4397 domain-containing protein [Caloranaerobacter sp. DY30410]|uniref:DUF4397 domain-containing protein n=1 Tax=Caloranaerobacter sp. DY30410 TaxID=3238305 RepID=UPI003CFE3889
MYECWSNLNFCYNPMYRMHSYVRFLHASPGTSNIDILMNNKDVSTNLSYKDFTEYFPVYHGRYNIKVFPAGNRTKVLIDTDINILPGSIFTVSVIGKLEDISLYPILDPRLPIPMGKVCLRFIHLSPDTPPVDVRLSNGALLFSNIGYKQITNYILLSPATYNFDIYLAATNKRILYVPNASLSSDKFYSIYFIGSSRQEPSLQVLIPLDGNSYLRF